MTEQNRPSYHEVVKELQHYFYIISQTDPEIPRLNPDGIYSEATAEAVRSFQTKIMGRTDADGCVDYETWQALLRHYRAAEQQLGEPQRISPFGTALKNGRLSPGDRCDLVLIVKLMMNCIGIDYRCAEGLTADDRYDDGLTEAVTRFQITQGLPETGEIDRITWNRLAMVYNKIVSDPQ